MTDSAAGGSRENSERGDRDEFDRIVSGVDWDFDTSPATPVDDPPVKDPPSDLSSEEFASTPASEDEQFYRRVTPTARRWRRGTTLAWLAVLGSPVLLVLVATTSVYLSRPIMAVVALGFLAGASYLITNLPEHGPADDDFPDDGAVL